MAVSLSLTLILIDYLFIRKFNARVIVDKVPFFAISLVFGLIAIFATHTGEQTEIYYVYPILERIQFAGYGLLFYLYKLILPLNLSAFYPYPAYQPGSLPLYYWLYPLGAVIITGLVIYSIRHTRKIIFGFGFFIVTIIMVLQLVPTAITIVADRYSYIPYIGLFYLAGEGYAYLAGKKVCIIHLGSLLGNLKYIQILAFSIFIVFSFLSYNRIKVWQNSIVLWTDVIEKYPNTSAYNNRGYAKDRLNDYDEALKDYNSAIQINPNVPIVYVNRGNCKVNLKD
ncbi:MAG: tetratricopeptide repeat protein, partial [Bacteroidota bacterium]